MRYLTLRNIAATCAVLFALKLASDAAGNSCRRGMYLDPTTNLCEEDPCADTDCTFPRRCGRGPGKCEVDCEYPYVKEGTLCVDSCVKNCKEHQTCKGYIRPMGDGIFDRGCDRVCDKGYLLSKDECFKVGACHHVACPLRATCSEVDAGNGKTACMATCESGFMRKETSSDNPSFHDFECVPTVECGPKSCPRHGTCKISEESGDCQVTCDDGFDFVEAQRVCVRNDVCASFSCPENAVCSESEDGKSCEARCVSGYKASGNMCEPVPGFSPCDAYECPEGAVCRAVGSACQAFKK